MTVERKRVLLVGKDARTDMLAATCLRSRHRPELFAIADFRIPGLVNKCDGGVEVASVTDIPAVMDYVRRVRPHLVIIGPEEPLEAGLADALMALGISCFGPERDLAKVETSKIWTRQVAARHGVPGAPRFEVVTDGSALGPTLRSFGDFVVKPDGLTGGKGVRVFGEHLQDLKAAEEYGREVIRDDGRVLIEERLEGQEFSLMSLTDGRTVAHFPLVQDHKRADEGDTGPNTGGMGSYSCADFSLPFLHDDEVAEARAINEHMVRALRDEVGRPYRGVLYGGFMATAHGVRLIEYNARLGDPEAMNVLPLLETDFLDVCEAVANGTLGELDIRFRKLASVCKYVVPAEYPSGKGAGDIITLPEGLADEPGLEISWAAVNLESEQFKLTGSRGVAFTGFAPTLAEAEAIAERGAASVQGPVRHRSDIGTAEVVGRRSEHMLSLRR